jgi:hypothetical protein
LGLDIVLLILNVILQAQDGVDEFGLKLVVVEMVRTVSLVSHRPLVLQVVVNHQVKIIDYILLEQYVII